MWYLLYNIIYCSQFAHSDVWALYLSLYKDCKMLIYSTFIIAISIYEQQQIGVKMGYCALFY